jgi:magnesium transporter
MTQILTGVKIQGMAFAFLSELLNKKIKDSEGKMVGKVTELVTTITDPPEPYPEISGLIVNHKKQRKFIKITGEELLKLSLEPSLRLTSTAPEPLVIKENQILVREMLFDRQVVDVKGAKVERVNDIHIVIWENRCHLVHVDVGFTGLSRRLGFEKPVRAISKFFGHELKDEFISWKYVQLLQGHEGLSPVKISLLHEQIHQLHAGELADIIEDLDHNERLIFMRTMQPEEAAEVLEEADQKVQSEVLRDLEAEIAADILEEMDSAAAADAMEDIPEDAQKGIMAAMEAESRETLQILGRAEEETAASLMTVDFISCPESSSIDQAFEALKTAAAEIDTLSYVYCLDKQGRLTGVVSVRDLILAGREQELTGIMHPRLAKVSAADDYGTVAEQFFKYRFKALPVVDPEGRVEGIIDFYQSFDELLPYYNKLAA